MCDAYLRFIPFIHSFINFIKVSSRSSAKALIGDTKLSDKTNYMLQYMFETTQNQINTIHKT